MIGSSQLYDIYEIEIRMRDRLCGGVPKNPDLIKAWVEAKTKHSDKQSDALTEDARAALLHTVEESSWNGFLADAEQGIFIEARQIKALFKECASLLRITTEKIGSKQILQHGFEVKALDGGPRIYVGTDKADGYDEKPIHVTTAQGPRTAIKRVDYVECVTLTCRVWVLKTAPAEKRHVGQQELEQMLALAQENGLGADRSQGQGKFDVVRFERVDAPAKKAKAV